MSAAHESVKAEFMPDGRLRLLEPYREVPAGFVTDGASVPRFFWRVLGHPFDGRKLGPSLRHDWHYEQQDVPRAQADAEYYCDLRAEGVTVPEASLYWLGVRLAGWAHWGRSG